MSFSVKKASLFGLLAPFLAAGSLALVSCKTTDDSGLSAGGDQGGYSVSFYDPSAFNDRCSPPAGLDSSKGMGPAEGLFGVSCVDNWVLVSDPSNVQDVEPGDIQNAKDKGYSVNSKLDYLKLALEKCSGSCVKYEGGKYYINLPSCPNLCQNKTYTLKTNLTGDQSVKIFVESACPGRHWKNLFKAAIGVDNNHCATPTHVDLSTGLFNALDIGYHNQGQLRAYITED